MLSHFESAVDLGVAAITAVNKYASKHDKLCRNMDYLMLLRCVCLSTRPLQVQPAGLPLPERRHHAKPTVWSNSLLQRPLLQVFRVVSAVSELGLSPSCFSLGTFLDFFLYLCHDFHCIFITAVSLPCSQPARGSWHRRTASPPTACRRFSPRTSSVTFCLWVTLRKWSKQNPVWLYFLWPGGASRLLLPFVGWKELTFDRHDCHSAVMLIKN